MLWLFTESLLLFHSQYCNKVFKTEQFLEKHFVNRHNHTIKAEGVCLADYCPLLECDLHANDNQGSSCNTKTMKKRQHRCQSLIDRCFPPHHSEAANQLHHTFEKLYCAHLACDPIGKKPLSFSAKLVESTARLQAVRNDDSNKSEGWRKFGIVMFILFIFLLLIFYMGVCLYRKDMGILDDLRKLSNARRRKRLELIKSKQF
jgi:hypothetical protein